MKTLNLPADIKPRSGNWGSARDISVRNVRKRDIYHAPVEPSYLAWAILWKESTGRIKLSFVEAAGDKTAWPPVYNFNSRDIEYYLKTLVSDDGGERWRDTGWREDLDPIWELNPDHHIRHVFELPDGTLVRNYCHTLEGVTTKHSLHLYDENKEGVSDFPYGPGPLQDIHPKFASISTSDDGGKTWREIHLFDGRPPLFLTAIHPLRDGTIVALGAIREVEHDYSTWKGAVTESRDQGRTWSTPLVVAENDDRLNPQGIGEECDFVELPDGRLLVIWRTDAAGSCMRQAHLQRRADGAWQAAPLRLNPFFVHSGYPYMHRASDGTIFYYCHTSLKYSCDDGDTWGQLPLGSSYYGQLTEVSPGRMLAVTQKNIGDCPYSWKHDVSMRQTTFDYERIGVARQLDEECSGALAVLDVVGPADFHVAMQIDLAAAAGLAYQVCDSGYRFVALTIPANESRLPTSAPAGPQSVLLQIGTVSATGTRVLRRIGIGKVTPGSRVELQVSRQGNLLKAAVNLPIDHDWGTTYTCFRDESPAPGQLALLTNKSPGTFRQVRFADRAETIRDNWLCPTDQVEQRMALDAGRGADE